MEIEARGLTFDVYADGPPDGEPVLLLHGFPQDHREFELIAPRLHEAGLRTYALDQRGYSPGACPDGVAAYRLPEACADAVAVLDALGLDSVHVVGHDWGAHVGWLLAAEQPQRVRSYTSVSVPHPRALATALSREPRQRLRFAYMGMFRARFAERLMLARDGAMLRSMLKPIGPRAAGYAAAMRTPGRLTGALNWYRALTKGQLAGVGQITVPTTYVWGEADPVLGRTAALATGDCVDADYRLVALHDVGHWVPEEAPRALADAVLERTGV
ncbi:alpha/beta fold hydrolase [Krasilnikovia sp. MM14-A1259]|uniref:alpha/beta fold hydrolase n=1 Tax=Krasilnikovia sp. MM14-A1259 TaxID=3373539 RepID=UPI0037FBB173